MKWITTHWQWSSSLLCVFIFEATISHNFNIAAIEGEHEDSIRTWFEDAGYRFESDNLQKNNRHHELALPTTHFTFIYDCDIVDESFFESLSLRIDERVIQLVCSGTGNSYGFICWKNGRVVRSLWCTEGQIVENSGSPLSEESGISIDASLSEEGMLELASKLGCDANHGRLISRFLLTNPYHSRSVSIPNPFIGRIASTVVCLISAVILFNTSPGIAGASKLVDFLMWYGFSATIYVLAFHHLLCLPFRGYLERFFGGGFVFQLPFAGVFLLAFAVGKFTGWI